MHNTETGKQAEIIQLVVFRLGDEEFGVQINKVKEIVRLIPITPIPKAPKFIEGIVNLRGEILAVIDLSKRLDIPSKPRSERTRIVVIEINENIVGMIVDEVSEVLNIPLSNIEKTPQVIESDIKQKYITSVGKLKDRLLILIDLAAILSLKEVEEVKNLEIKKTTPEKNSKS
ncbi:MAG: purine-binding chemotaxis protein CheW [Candidatus Omnitrophica bacterium]|nr:purine-binding chemotaxis protein CheW [Candidatus Omnitrophota bacterium]